jgi:hypothetical protein
MHVSYCSRQKPFRIIMHVLIILNNVSTDAMYYLSDRITSVDEGVQDVIAAPNTEYLGKYKVLVNKAKFHQVRKTLLASLNTWYNMHVPEDAKQSSEMYSGKPEVAPLHTDGLSSGDGTYMSSSVWHFLPKYLQRIIQGRRHHQQFPLTKNWSPILHPVEPRSMTYDARCKS